MPIRRAGEPLLRYGVALETIMRQSGGSIEPEAALAAAAEATDSASV